MCQKIDQYIGNKIRSIRQRKEISEKACASHLGISENDFNQYEAGQKRIGASQLYSLTQFLDVPISDFYDGLSE